MYVKFWIMDVQEMHSSFGISKLMQMKDWNYKIKDH